jgi:hypothetical protein
VEDVINNDTKQSAKSNAVQAKGTIKTMFDTVRFLIDCGGRSCGVVWYGTQLRPKAMDAA